MLLFFWRYFLSWQCPRRVGVGILGLSMDEAEQLLKRMRSLILRAEAQLVSFISVESLSLGEVASDWIASTGSASSSRPGSCQIYIREQETEQLIKQRRIETWVKARRMFAPEELDILAGWQKLETKALTLSINIVLRKNLTQR